MNNTLVSRSDYELYTIKLPWLISRKKRRQLIAQELEKIHPCFGQQTEFDQHLCFKKGSVFAKVAVMDKLKLLDYQISPKRGLKLEGCSGSTYFGKQNYELVLGILSAVVLGLILLLFACRRDVPVQNFEVQTLNDVSETQSDDAYSSEEIQKIFSVLRESKGRISAMTYAMESVESQSWECGLEISGAYPEQLLLNKSQNCRAEYSGLVYKEKIPSFNYKLFGKEDILFDNSSNEIDVGSLRDFVLKHGAEIKSESPGGKWNLVFSSVFFNCFLKSFLDFLDEEKILLENFCLSKNGEMWSIDFVFSGRQSVTVCKSSGNLILRLTVDYPDLFVAGGKSSDKVSKGIPLSKKIDLPPAQRIPDTDAQEVGKVLMPDGSYIYYMKKQDGSIYTEKIVDVEP